MSMYSLIGILYCTCSYNCLFSTIQQQVMNDHLQKKIDAETRSMFSFKVTLDTIINTLYYIHV